MASLTDGISLPTTARNPLQTLGITNADSVLSNITSSGLGSKLAGALGGGNGTFTALGSMFGPWGTAIGGGIDLATKLFGGLSSNKKGGEEAAKVQGYYTNYAKTIQDQVKAGTMPAGTAIRLLDDAIAQAYAYGQGNTSGESGGQNYDAQQMQIALANLRNVRGNLADTYNWQVGTLDSSAGKGGQLGTVNDALRDPTAQQDYMKTAIRNKLMGYGEGDKALAGSPIETLFKPFDVGGTETIAREKALAAIPSYERSDDMQSLLDKLQKGLPPR